MNKKGNGNQNPVTKSVQGKNHFHKTLSVLRDFKIIWSTYVR